MAGIAVARAAANRGRSARVERHPDKNQPDRGVTGRSGCPTSRSRQSAPSRPTTQRPREDDRAGGQPTEQAPSVNCRRRLGSAVAAEDRNDNRPPLIRNTRSTGAATPGQKMDRPTAGRLIARNAPEISRRSIARLHPIGTVTRAASLHASSRRPSTAQTVAGSLDRTPCREEQPRSSRAMGARPATGTATRRRPPPSPIRGTR